MGGESPNVVLYDVNGNPLAVQNGSAISASTPALLVAGSDGTNSRYLTVDTSGRQVIVGAGTAGTATGGVITIQGVAGGTAIPVSGTVISSVADTTGTGTLGALNATVSIAVTGENNAGMQLVAGTLVGTIIPEVSLDGGTTWVSTFFDDPVTGNVVSSIVFGSSNSATTRTLIGVGGASNMRVRVSAYTSGTATCNMRASTMQDPTVLFANAAGGVLPPTVVQMGGSVTTGSPTYTTGTLNALSLTTAGAIRIDGSAVTQPVSGTITANAGTGNFVVTQATASNLNATVVASGNFNNASVSTTGAAPPGSATYAGGSVTTVAPTYTTGQMSPLSLDTAGNLRITGTISASNPSVGTIGSTTPTSATTIGGTDGTNLQTVRIKAASTAAVATDPSLVIANSPNSPLPSGTNTIGRINISDDITIIHNAATVTTGGTIYINGIGRKEISFGVYIGGAVTGGTPALTYVIQEVDAVTNTFDMTLPGNTVTNGPFVSTSHNNYVEMVSYTGAVRVTWTCSGTFAGVDAWMVVKEASLTQGLTFGGITNPLSVINIDANDNTIVVGAGADGSAVVGNPVLVAGQNSGTTHILTTNVTGNLLVAQAAVTGASLANAWTTKITDTTNGPVAVKAASTAAVATDLALVVAVSPNNSVAVTQATAANLNVTDASTKATGGTVPTSASMVGGTDGTNLRAISVDTSGRQIMIGAAASGAAIAGNPVRIGGMDGLQTNAESLTVSIDRAGMTQGVATGVPILGQSSGVGRIARSNRLGHIIPGYQTLLAIDSLDQSSGLNTYIWTSSLSTMTITVSGNQMQLNANSTLTNATYAIITSNKQFPVMQGAPIGITFRINIASADANAVQEFGFGNPATNTVLIPLSACFRIKSSGGVFAVFSEAGSETISAQLATINVNSYYTATIWIEDSTVRFILESSGATPAGIPLVDYIAYASNTDRKLIRTSSHIPAFARVYNSGATTTAPQLNITDFEVWQYDINTSRPWSEQMACVGRSATLNPTTFAQTGSSMTAAPATETPSNTTGGYNVLGGDYAVALTPTATENPLSVFGFQIPSPYAFVLTGITLSLPVVTTAISVTGIPFIEWFAIANCASANISTGGGQRFPLCINHYYTSITQAAGVTLNLGGGTTAGAAGAGGSQSWYPKVPIICLPGTFLHIGYKVFITSAAGTPGVTRGSVYVDGFFE